MHMLNFDSKTPRYSTNLQLALLLGLVLLSLLVGLHTINCCGTEVLPSPPVVTGEPWMVQQEDGNWLVSSAWMVERMEYEQGLLTRLDQLQSELFGCQNGDCPRNDKQN
jgi:hypothetical protein